LHAVLQDVAKDLTGGRAIHEATALGRDWLEGAGFKVDYLEVRSADSLMPVGQQVVDPSRLLVAAWLGRTRLIDNVPVAPIRMR
jgi:pantoate--beta-alanine ligase